MPKLIINDKSGRMDSSMDFFLDGKFIAFKETKKEIEDVDYGEHTIKAQTLFLKSLNQKINIEKEVTEIEIKLDWKNKGLAIIAYVCWIYLVFIEKGENTKFVLGIIIFSIVVYLYRIFRNTLIIELKK